MKKVEIPSDMIKMAMILFGSTPEVVEISDMSASYLSAVREVFPNAKQTIDKFHVKQVLLKALDTVRNSYICSENNFFTGFGVEPIKCLLQ